MPKLKITPQYAKEFDLRCAKADSHGFLRFITKPNANDVSLLDTIAKVEGVIRWSSPKQDKYVELNEQNISRCMNEFFSLYLPKKSAQVEQILNHTHPYFTDRAGGYHANFINVDKNDPRSSNVGHLGTRSFLELNVYIRNSLDDLIITAHELTHALSAHHQNIIKIIRANTPIQELEKSNEKCFEKDCIGEIESHITEKLFNRYMVDVGLYSQEDLQNYEKEQQTSLLNEVNLIREEKNIISYLTCPVSYESLKGLVEILQKQNQDRLVERVKKMHESNGKYSSNMFRYVVGRIVSDQWIKQYDKAQDQQTKNDMLNTFQSYLDKTHELDLDSACNDLLGQDFVSVAENYVKDKTNELKKSDVPTQ